MSVKKSNETKLSNSESVVAKSDDGTIQITFTVPYSKIKRANEEVAKEYTEKVDVPGFRPGKAPLEKILEKIPENTLLEKSLSKILPGLLSEAIKKHKIKPAVYPKFEIISSKENEDWQIRAVTCELPDIDLKDYKKELSSIKSSTLIWTPGKDKKDNKEITQEEKEQKVINFLIDYLKINIPKILIENEVNSNLSKLLERIEKLGLTLESYLSSINKTAQNLREEYENQARRGIMLELILTKIANDEKITVEEKDVDSAVNALKDNKEFAKDAETPERRKFIEAILKRRKALDYLTSLL